MVLLLSKLYLNHYIFLFSWVHYNMFLKIFYYGGNTIKSFQNISKCGIKIPSPSFQSLIRHNFESRKRKPDRTHHHTASRFTFLEDVEKSTVSTRPIERYKQNNLARVYATIIYNLATVTSLSLKSVSNHG